MKSDGVIKNVSIKLVSVDFVPSWETTDVDDGRTIKHSSIGQKFIEAKDLPLDLRERLEEFVLSVMKSNLGE